VGQGKTGVCVPKILYKKIVSKRKGISSWLPKIAYRLPFKFRNVVVYKAERDKILKNFVISKEEEMTEKVIYKNRKEES